MTPGIATATPEAGRHLLLYDGECGFCHAVVRFVLEWDRRAVFEFAALQGVVADRALARFGARPADLTTFYVIERHRTDRPVLRSRSAAALLVARALGWPWSVTCVLEILPRAWRDAAYDRIARHRHLMLGRAEACFVPRPEHRARFLDVG